MGMEHVTILRRRQAKLLHADGKGDKVLMQAKYN